MKYKIHLIGSTLETLDCEVVDVVPKTHRRVVVGTILLEGGTKLDVPMCIPAQGEADQTIQINVWALNDALIAASVCDPTTRILTSKEFPGPVFRYSLASAKAVDLAPPKSNIDDSENEKDAGKMPIPEQEDDPVDETEAEIENA